jgi:hypothetical protein
MCVCVCVCVCERERERESWVHRACDSSRQNRAELPIDMDIDILWLSDRKSQLFEIFLVEL